MVNVTKVPNKPEWKVTLDKKVVGKIIFLNPEFQYKPNGSTPGEKFPTLNACIDSLKGD